ncbi:MAG: DUF2264 domain-containing protein [Chitinophagaceae bacterium]|nr:MAG: DUF2264 domain-containing protein [Chitinophagaceae bacterium]
MKTIVKQALLFIVLLISIPSIGQKKRQSKPVQTTVNTGLQDRSTWVKYLYKIAYPVIHNLAENSLRKNMPVEVPPGLKPDFFKKVTHLEAVGRTLAGIAPWLELPDDNTEEGLLRKKLKVEIIKGLTNAVDPSSPDYLNFRTEHQPIVDAAYLAQAFLRAPNAFWKPLDVTTKKRFVTEFKSLRNRTGAYNNWLLFAGITETFLKSIDEEYDPFRVSMAKNKMKEWYVGDSWYNDGPKFSMDYYNDYVIHPMMMDMYKALLDKKLVAQAEYDEVLKRAVRHSEFSERIISPEGTYPAIGRSITYRSAAFQTLSQIALMEKLPSFIQPAQVRCGLTAVYKNLFEGNQNFDADGWLVLGFNGHQPEVADTYTSTGSLYMATLGFMTLGLPAHHPFWNDAPADWTSRKAWKGATIKKDYKVEY